MHRYLFLILLFAIFSTGLVMAQSNSSTPVAYVYRIKSAGCTHSPDARRQTGFRVQGQQGIITALHGVADCQTISAVTDDGQEIFNDLHLQAVDIARDIALFSSPALEQLPLVGLTPSTLDYDHIPRQNLWVIGYPLGLDKQDRDIGLSIREIESLDDVIPDPEESVEFRNRHSPDVTIMVLNMQAQLLPGHSGAPILDADNQIIGIANGGLRGGTVGRSWAIPWRDVDLHPIDESAIAASLAALKGQDAGIALAFSSTYQQSLDGSVETQSFIGLVTNENGQPVVNAEVTLSFTDRFYIDNTDSIGRYRFSFNANDLKKIREILVESEGYEIFRLKVSDQLPDQIILKSIYVPRRPKLERGSYIRVTWPLGLKMRSAPRFSAPIITNLADRVILKLTDGPRQDNELQWWEVQPILGDNSVGWIIPADSDVAYIESLPLIVNGDTVEIVEERLRVHRFAGTDEEIIGALDRGEKLKVVDGPQKADGYLWYKLEKSGGVQGWSRVFGEADYVKKSILSPTSTETPTALPTVTSTAPMTSTLTPTPLSTYTITSMPTATKTSLPTATQTPTPRITPTLTNTSTPTDAATLTATETWTSTVTQTIAQAFAPTVTPTPSATNALSTRAQTPTTTPVKYVDANSSTPKVTNHTNVTVNLRSGPGLSYSVIDSLKPGESLEVIGRHSLFGISDDENWWQVSLANRSTGWVRRDIVDESGDFTWVPIISGYFTPTPTSIPLPITPTTFVATSTPQNRPTSAPPTEPTSASPSEPTSAPPQKPTPTSKPPNPEPTSAPPDSEPTSAPP